MNAYNQIISKQIQWAKNKGLQLIGSQGKKGQMVYTTTLEDNLFKPLYAKTKNNLENGDGGELSGMKDRPARIQALHSSSALGINVFDYWRKSIDLSNIISSCGFSRSYHKITGEILFEQKYPIDKRFKKYPNVDVVIFPDYQTSRFKAFAIECKFTEPYSSHGHGGLKHKYIENEDIWQNLKSTKDLAEGISPVDNKFQYLHAAQLIKHILGLNRKFGHSRYRFLYLWYDALGEPGLEHRKEIGEFAEVVRSDGILFHEKTYQNIIIRLAQYREDHSEYIKYLTERYL